DEKAARSRCGRLETPTPCIEELGIAAHIRLADGGPILTFASCCSGHLCERCNQSEPLCPANRSNRNLPTRHPKPARKVRCRRQGRRLRKTLLRSSRERGRCRRMRREREAG